MAQRLAGHAHHLDDTARLLGGVFSRSEAGSGGCGGQARHVVIAQRAAEFAQLLDALGRDGLGGAEVDQRDAAAGSVEEVVAEVRVGLHQPHAEELVHREPAQRRRDVVALRLRAAAGFGEAVDGQAGRERGGDDVVGAMLVGHRGHAQHRVVTEQSAVRVGGAGFCAVVGLVLELRLNASEQRRHVERRRHQPGCARQQRQIGHVAGDALANTGVLDLQRQHTPFVCLGAMHLTDRCGGDRLVAEATEPPVPPGAVFALKHLGELGRRHHMGLVAQPAEQFGEVRRQHAVAVHRHQLADFHHGATHLRQPFSKPTRVARGQHQLRQIDALAACQPAQPIGGGAGCHLADRAAEVPKALCSTFGNWRTAPHGARVRNGAVGQGGGYFTRAETAMRLADDPPVCTFALVHGIPAAKERFQKEWRKERKRVQKREEIAEAPYARTLRPELLLNDDVADDPEAEDQEGGCERHRRP